MVCRRKGMPEPSHDDLHIKFHFKMVEEWRVRRAGEAAASAPDAGCSVAGGAGAGAAAGAVPPTDTPSTMPEVGSAGVHGA